MHQYMNEDEAWRRLQDLQREMENRRLMAAARPHATFEAIRQLASLAVNRLPRRRSASIRRDGEHRSHVA